MALSGWLWAGSAGLALLTGVWIVSGRDRAQQGRQLLRLGLLVASLLTTLIGLGWQAWESRSWPGSTPPEAFAYLAGGSLVVAAWLTLRTEVEGRLTGHRVALGPTLIAAAILLAAATWLLLNAAASATSALPPSRTWLLGLRNLLASIGLGGWIVAWTASMAWILQIWRRSRAAQARMSAGEVETDSQRPEVSEPEAAWPAEDLGRRAALFSFPWLTGACLCGVAWNLTAHAAIVRAAPAELWTLSAWLLGAAYLHVTSSWRPLRLPGWLATALAALVVVAGVLAASNAGSLR
ncbi:MAG: hypothetical protein N2204_00715 [Anaerolineae bacterium]|nr:hypothetical protein [Anaerolineae bacterium]